MRCLKTRTLLGLLTAAWLLGVVYFLKDIKRTGVSTHDGDSYLEDYEKFIDSNNDFRAGTTTRIGDRRVSGHDFKNIVVHKSRDEMI